LNVNINPSTFFISFDMSFVNLVSFSTFNEVWWSFYLFTFVTSKTMNDESFCNFLPLSNSKKMNLVGLHFFLLLLDSRRMKSNDIFIFLPLLHSKSMNLITILSFVFHRFYNHELKVSSYILRMLNFETMNLNKSSYIWPLLDFGTLNLNRLLILNLFKI
jgi:hypothetical protein